MLSQMEPWYDDQEKQALVSYLNGGGWMADHVKTREFERLIAEYAKVGHCIVVNNATSALFLALKALDIGPGDEVIVPDFTMVATANAVVLAGAKPVFVDIETQSLCLDLDEVERALTPQTKAIIPVDLNGRCVDYHALYEMLGEKPPFIIEDAAQAMGSTYCNLPLGYFGTIGVFSFSCQKIISTGNGGALLCNDERLATKLRMLKDFGRERGGCDEYLTMGWNFKFTDLQAIVGIEQMKKLDWRVNRKKEMFYLYRECLKEAPVTFIYTDLEQTSPWFIDILAPRRDQLAAYLKQKGVGTRPFYPALHSQPVYNQPGHFPSSEHVAKLGLWLPSSSFLTDGEIIDVCNCIKEFYDIHHR